ncbi:DUF3857 domain-containing protein [Tamlana sp. 2201CG12-4]|uniref:DUF3857 domain-containing protein n=1 Tax=Tamlana sp. 2201CG12-4 TaxID=3112582 RepID=UPI002DBDC663|nr:DUF3857 domain-containing protein [Tamlana sp. 2201CG12-4]MEC3905600.1 DUF3857 domain-containing protein [Tamlana sp. 2201CG12-4]
MRKIAVLIAFSFTLTTYAQNFKFGKVSKEELQEKFSPIDSIADAAYLYKHRNTFFNYNENEGFQLITEIHERVKIYNKEGFDYATKAVRLYKNSSDEEEMAGLKAYTYNIVDGKVEDTKLGKESIFETEISKYRNETKFTMPNIKKGSVIEYKYKIISPFISKVDEFVFQYDIPVKKLEARFEAPEYFIFKLNTKGYIPIMPTTETKHGKITFRSKTRSYTGTKFSSSDLDFSKQVSTYNLSDVQALTKEPHVNNIDNYRSSIKYELSYTKFPETPIEYYSTTWEDVVKKIYDSNGFGSELNKTGYYEEEIDAIINFISDPKKRVALIFNFIKNKVKWNGYYGYMVDEGVRKAFKNNVGNVAEINLMLTSMLRYAGLKAYPVLVSTRGHGIPLFPTREGYNYVVSYVKFVEGDGILLDATSIYCMPNILPFRTLNWKGRVINEKGNSTFVDLYPKHISKNTVSVLVSLDENGDIEGGCRSIKTNHNALSYREKINGVDKDDYIEKLDNEYNGLEISNFDVKNSAEIYKPIQESYKFEKESQADVIGDKMYFSPLFFFRETQNPFKLEKREFPIDFGYPSETTYRVVISLPKGYKVESLPDSGVFQLPDNLGTFKYNVSLANNSIQAIISSKINSPIIGAEYYETLKLYFSQLVEKEGEQIVLTRI